MLVLWCKEYSFPANIYLFKFNIRNTARRCKICSKLTIKTLERRQWHRSSVFYCQLWTYFTPFTSIFIADLEEVNVSWVTLLTFLAIPNIDPIDTKQSIFEDPSSGSKYTIYFPCLSVSTSTIFSFSSDTIPHTVYEDRNMFINNSLDNISSFCTLSPVTFSWPATPNLKISSKILKSNTSFTLTKQKHWCNRW